MSHFTVTVCTENASLLEAALAPFDEELEVESYEEDGETYTRNPRAKWDWWVIGGRWPGRFPYRQGYEKSVLQPKPHWGDPDASLPPLHCDGGPVRALDLGKLRDEAAITARKTWAEWEKVTTGTPDALPWSVFAENISEGNGYTIEQAREEYHSQPRIRALEGTDFMGYDNPVTEFGVGKDRFTEMARAKAVPGWATLTLDGRWMEQGEMGWFGMSSATESSTIGYAEAANAYIGQLPDDTWLISVDCHT